MQIKEELERIQKLADDIWFFTDRILTHPDFIKEIPLESKTPIEQLNLSAYAVRCLERRNIDYVEQLPKREKELIRIRGIGKQTADEIINKVKNLGFKIKE